MRSKAAIIIFCVALVGCQTATPPVLEPRTVAPPTPIVETMAAVEYRPSQAEISQAIEEGTYSEALRLIEMDHPRLVRYRQDLERTMVHILFYEMAEWKDHEHFGRVLRRGPLRRVETDSLVLNADDGDLRLEVGGVRIPPEEVDAGMLFDSLERGIRRALDDTRRGPDASRQTMPRDGRVDLDNSHG